MDTRPTPVFKFNTAQKKWLIHEHSSSIPEVTSFSILNFNVLFDEWNGIAYKPHVVCSPIRYQQQFQEFKAANCDFLCLNEVTPNYIKLLIQEQWVQEHYYISDITGDTLLPFGNVFLSKFPFHDLQLAYLTKLVRPIVCAKIPFQNQTLLIATTHFSAQKENHERRQIQVKELTSFLDRQYPKADKIILGDVNYHTEKEIVPDKYTDSWTSLYPNSPGITFNGVKNTMLHELWPLAWMYGFKDDIQMRLDRVFVLSKHWKPIEMKICINEPIYEAKRKHNFVKDVLSVLGDKFGVNLCRNPKNYLFPSDHFGLISTFEFKID